MNRGFKGKLTIATTALAAAAFAGGAFAATQESDVGSRQAFLNDVAQRLHVTPQQLTSALNSAAADQLQAAVKAGKLTQAQADALRQRLQQDGDVPLWLGPPALPGLAGPHMMRAPGELGAAATYLGLTDTQLFSQLASGKSLAQIAQARGKSVAGLEQAMTAALQSKLDKAVADKDITKAEEQQFLSKWSAQLNQLVNSTAPRFGIGPRGLWRELAPDSPGAAVPRQELPAPPSGIPTPPAWLPSDPAGLAPPQAPAAQAARSA